MRSFGKMLCWVTVVLLAAGGPSWAFGALGVESTSVQKLELPSKPRDVAVSEDGQWVFVLGEKEVMVYRAGSTEPLARINVQQGFDRLVYSGVHQALILTSQESKSMEVLRLEFIQDVAIDGHPFRGPENARVTIAVFDDYQCPYCARLEPQLKQVLQKYPNDVKLVIKQFPLQSHPQAMPAAKAALAAHRQGKFWEFHEMLFEKQKELNDAKINEIAQSLGLDMEKFQNDVKDPAIQEMINKDIQNGYQVQVRGTPTIFVNGKLVRRPDFTGIVQMVEEELKKTASK